MNVPYGDACLSLQQVYEWTGKFMNGISSVTDSTRPGARVAALSLSAKRMFFSRGIHALPKHWNTCMKGNGDYIEKWSHCVPFVFNKLRDKNVYIFMVFIRLSLVCRTAMLLPVESTWKIMWGLAVCMKRGTKDMLGLKMREKKHFTRMANIYIIVCVLLAAKCDLTSLRWLG